MSSPLMIVSRHSALALPRLRRPAISRKLAPSAFCSAQLAEGLTTGCRRGTGSLASKASVGAGNLERPLARPIGALQGLSAV